MILLVDIGNTRIKWATFDGRDLSPSQAGAHKDWTHDVVERKLLAPIAKPTRVIIANVAGPHIADIVSSALQSKWALTAEFVQSSRQAGGVRSGYRIPEQLGVDRWLAAIAAYNLEKRPVCIANVGTALTVDGVDSQGRHLGGIIVPGPQMMLAGLFRETGEIEQRARVHDQTSGDAAPTLFADNTRDAVENGVTEALAATIERAHADLCARVGAASALVLSGGGAGRIASALRVPFRMAPDLVLRGLAELARVQPV